MTSNHHSRLGTFLYDLPIILVAAAPVVVLWVIFNLSVKSARYAGVRGRKVLLKTLGLPNDRRVVGYFHPYCNAGGGGERVLWTAIAFSQRTDPNAVSVVYSGDVDASKEIIIDKVKSRFDITLDPSSLHFVFLPHRWLIEDTTWKAFTLLGQSLGSMLLAWQAMGMLIPDIYIDTMGYAFTFPIVQLIAPIPVGAYVHYPTISTEMLRRVTTRQAGVTNSSVVSNSSFLTRVKLFYYRVFMFYYSRSLRSVSFAMVNSSWTKAHVDSILSHSDLVLEILHSLSCLRVLFPTRLEIVHSSQIVYPPCDTRAMSKLPLAEREKVILSVAQFRPEKNHVAQLLAFATLRETYPQDDARLVLLGGSRNNDDAQRVDDLRALATKLGISEDVHFVVNASYTEMLAWLSKSSVGLSTMVDEHFGINVVELMAAGVIPVAHASGGPLHDIIVPFEGKSTGYHAKTPEEFADAIHIALNLPPDEEMSLRTRTRTWAVQRFSEQEFEKSWDGSGWKTVMEEHIRSPKAEPSWIWF